MPVLTLFPWLFDPFQMTDMTLVYKVNLTDPDTFSVRLKHSSISHCSMFKNSTVVSQRSKNLRPDFRLSTADCSLPTVNSERSEPHPKKS